jgi:outer membrane receptor for ferric coprogen and ferric-rhodotorulic acid
MDYKGFRLISITVTKTNDSTQDMPQSISEYTHQDLSDEELEEISEIKKLVCELAEPEPSFYTST